MATLAEPPVVTVYMHYEESGLRTLQPFHPYVFRLENDFFSGPGNASGLMLYGLYYRATSFPDKWTLVKDLMPGRMRSVFFQHDGNGGCSPCPTPQSIQPGLIFPPLIPIPPGPQHLHRNRRQQSVAAPGAAVLDFDGRLRRFNPGCFPPLNGKQVLAFEITD